MRDRIRLIMQAENMNASQFADAIGVQRATITHIMTERNEPSMNVIYKILEQFSDISPDWLLFGRGDMRRSSVTKGKEVHQTPEQPHLALFTDAEKPPIGSLAGNSALAHARSDKFPSTVNISPELGQKFPEMHKPIRKIERITVFYSDNTYETFRPDS